jgi:hypothetical protein
VTFNGSTTTYVSNVTWYPFGPSASIVYNNGVTQPARTMSSTGCVLHRSRATVSPHGGPAVHGCRAGGERELPKP